MSAVNGIGHAAFVALVAIRIARHVTGKRWLLLLSAGVALVAAAAIAIELWTSPR